MSFYYFDGMHELIILYSLNQIHRYSTYLDKHHNRCDDIFIVYYPFSQFEFSYGLVLN